MQPMIKCPKLTVYCQLSILCQVQGQWEKRRCMRLRSQSRADGHTDPSWGLTPPQVSISAQEKAAAPPGDPRKGFRHRGCCSEDERAGTEHKDGEARLQQPKPRRPTLMSRSYFRERVTIAGYMTRRLQTNRGTSRPPVRCSRVGLM